MRKKCFGYGFVLSFVLLIATHVSAVELKWAHVYEVKTPYHEAAVWAAGEVKKRTQGRVTIEVFPASSLGKEVAINEALGLGTIDIIYTGVGFAGRSYEPLSIGDYPFILRDFDHWKTYYASNIFAGLAKKYASVTGNSIVAVTYYGARHVTSNKPILNPEDMKSLKIRVPNAPAYVMFPKVVGANPTPMAFSEVYLALQQGVVDAQENPLPTIQFKKFYEVQSNINLTGHITNSLVTVVSPDTISKVKDDGPIVNQVLREAAERASGAILQAEKDLVSWFRDKGITVNEVDRKPFMDALKPKLISSDVPWDRSLYEDIQKL